MADELREIRARIDIVELVGRRVSLKRAGKVYKGLCPFHNDKNPSFTVNPELGMYRCWSCGEHGDVFTWTMKTQNVEFGDALRLLAEESGVTLAKRGKIVSKEEREVRKEAMETSLKFFQEQLSRHSAAKAYCEGRGLDAPTLAKWEVGFAPDVGEALAVHLKKKGLPLAECKELFLVDQDGAGGFFDRFRGRLMFPIRDERGELVAFGGRLLGKGEPKYINSSDTPLYRKSRVLYGMHQAREFLQKQRRAVLVEGYLDVIACHTAGVETALASCGTALAEDQCKLLKRWCDDVIVLYDGDSAGIKAARRAIGLLAAEELRTKIALPPAGDDPDSVLRARGPKAVTDMVDLAVSPMAFEFELLVKHGDPAEEAFWKHAVELLAQAPNAMEREKYVMKVAPLYPGFNDPLAAQRALKREVAQRIGGRPRAQEAYRERRPMQYNSELSGGDIRLIAAILHDDIRKDIWPLLNRSQIFASTDVAQTAALIVAALPEPPTGKLAEWFGEVPNEGQVLLETVMGMARAQEIDRDKIREEIQVAEKRIQEREHRQARHEVKNDEEKAAWLEKLRKLKGTEKKLE